MLAAAAATGAGRDASALPGNHSVSLVGLCGCVFVIILGLIFSWQHHYLVKHTSSLD